MDSKSAASTARYQALLQLLRAANLIWDASRIFFEHWNLSPSQFNVLNLLSSNPEGLSQTELGRHLLTHRSNITGLVDRLAKRGLVRRNATSADRRAYRVVLTKSGTNLLQDILPDYYKEADHVWDGITSEGIFELTRALEEVSKNALKSAERSPGRTKAKRLQ